VGVLVSRRHTDNHLFRQKIKKLYIFFVLPRPAGCFGTKFANESRQHVDMATGEWEGYIFEEVF
jgi:hypothetical protein